MRGVLPSSSSSGAAVGDLFGQRLRQFFNLLGSRHLVTQAKIRGALHQQHQQS